MKVRCNRCPVEIDDGIAHLVYRDGVSKHATPSFEFTRLLEFVCDGCLRPDEGGFSEDEGPRQVGPLLPQLDYACWQLLETIHDGVTVYRKHEKWWMPSPVTQLPVTVSWQAQQLKNAGMVTSYKRPRGEWKNYDYFSWLVMADEGKAAVALYRQRQLEGASSGVE